MQDYRKLAVWERAHRFTLEIYCVSKEFPKSEIFGITSQIRRAASSIPANISEGCGRNTSADLANFLNYALGSANEASYFSLLAKDLHYITAEDFMHIENEIEGIKAMLISLISKVRNNKK